MTVLLGYADRISAAPGETVRFMVSCIGAARYRAEIARVISPQAGPEARPFREDLVPADVNGEYPGRVQPIAIGSCAVVPGAPPIEGIESFTLQAMVWPTLPGDGRQAILGTFSETAGTGFGLGLDETGALELRLGAGVGRVSSLASGEPLAARHWYFVGASYDAATGAARLVQEPIERHGFETLSAVAREGAAGPFAPGPGPFLIAARHAGTAAAGATWGDVRTGGHFNGKIERPRLANRALEMGEMAALRAPAVPAALRGSVVGAWDLARETGGVRIVDIGPHGLHGECVNLPTRAMTGHNWSGGTADWRAAPEEYGAIHFHDDDIYDCRWQTDFALTITPEMRSGVYVARLTADDAAARIAFFVVPPRGTATSKLAFLAPTATYLAYTNAATFAAHPLIEITNGSLSTLYPSNLLHLDHPEIGYSTYDSHRDGSGVCYSSRLRPAVNVSPTGHQWNFPIDMFIIDWLEHVAEDYDVITDEDLDREGAALLAPYRAIVTASHPEYDSVRMLDALEAWVRDGGRFMYMGGNGFYWKIVYHDTLPGVMEVRRAEDGVRAWAAEPGEYHHSFDGTPGGLWRRQRRAPNVLAGVGFISQGFDSSSYYRRAAGADDPRAAFVFEGIEDEILGDFGRCLGGAAGLEIDCVDPALGTPSHTLVLASSERHTHTYELVCEEVLQGHPVTDATQNPDIRADMVFFETAGGGAVFSTGSIGYAGSLGTNDFDNNIARLTTNVLRRFLDPAPFAPPVG